MGTGFAYSRAGIQVRREAAMAHLWVETAEGAWAVMPLRAGAVRLGVHPPRAAVAAAEAVLQPGAVIVPCSGRRLGVWALIGGKGSDVRINGAAPPAGIRVLSDRDEIIVDNLPRVFFSTERLAEVEEFPGADSTVYCPRCRQVIPPPPRSPVVKCPGCGVFYHQSSDLPCWTYADVCSLCPQATALDTGYQWTPEAL